MLTLRTATLEDSHLLLEWRNDPQAIATSGTQRGVTQEEHDRWYRHALTDLTVHLYVAEAWVLEYGQMLSRDPEPPATLMNVGMGRINEERGVAVLSYSIDKNRRGCGYGGELVAALTAKAYELGYTSIQVVVRHMNTASLRTLLGQGFEIDPHELLRLTKEIER